MNTKNCTVVLLCALALHLVGCRQPIAKHGVHLILAPDKATHLKQTQTILSQRVQALKIRGATVKTSRGRIVVKIPGGERSDEVQQACLRVGRLEFRAVEDAATAFLANLKPQPTAAKTAPDAPDPGKTPVSPSVSPSPSPLPPLPAGIEVSMDRLYNSEPFYFLQSRQRLPLASYIAKLSSHLPKGTELLMQKVEAYQSHSWHSVLVKKVGLDVSNSITKASVEQDHLDLGQVVVLRFDDASSKAFADFTEANIKRRIAIVLDSEVNSAPVVQERISGGAARLTLGGVHSPQEQRSKANALAAILSVDALPGPVEFLVEEAYGSTQPAQ